MPNPYITYALAALSFGLAIAFFRVSEENSQLARTKITVEMQLETAEADAKSFREKFSAETKSREFAEAALTIAETSERAVRAELAREVKARQTAEKSLEDSETARHSVEAALSGAQEQMTALNAKLVEVSLLKEQSEAAKATDKAADPKQPAADAAPAGDAAASEADRPAPAAAEASMGGSQRSWFWGLFGW